jgi:2-methylcitrate dehydratase PrpD
VYPSQLPAVLTVHTTDGRVLVEEVLVNRGGPGNPLSNDELRQKFVDNTDGLLGPADSDAVIEACARLSTLGSLEDLMSPLRKVAR